MKFTTENQIEATLEFNEGFYHALSLETTSYEDCPYKDAERSLLWLEGYLEARYQREM